MIGRVRPYDGFISLSKEYVCRQLLTLANLLQLIILQVDGDRGRWLYRGYFVGNAYGNLVGRWRDTLSPPDVPGYEGCFALGRRR